MKNLLIRVVFASTLLISTPTSATQSLVQHSLARQIFASKIGALIIASLATKYSFCYSVNTKILTQTSKTKSSLPEPLQEEIKTYFKERHGITVELKDSEKCFPDTGIASLLCAGKSSSLCNIHYKKTNFILIPSIDRQALCNDYFGLTKEHVFAALDHEADHLKHNDIGIKAIGVLLTDPLPFITAKLVLIQGLNKKTSCSAFLLTSLLAGALLQAISKNQEKRCDLAAATTPEKCRHLVGYFRYYELAETRVDRYLCQLFGEHPLLSVRIAYLEKRAQELERVQAA